MEPGGVTGDVHPLSMVIIDPAWHSPQADASPPGRPPLPVHCAPTLTVRTQDGVSSAWAPGCPPLPVGSLCTPTVRRLGRIQPGCLAAHLHQRIPRAEPHGQCIPVTAAPGEEGGAPVKRQLGRPSLHYNCSKTLIWSRLFLGGLPVGSRVASIPSPAPCLAVGRHPRGQPGHQHCRQLRSAPRLEPHTSAEGGAGRLLRTPCGLLCR